VLFMSVVRSQLCRPSAALLARPAAVCTSLLPLPLTSHTKSFPKGPHIVPNRSTITARRPHAALERAAV
jgi:hypothetical protein